GEGGSADGLRSQGQEGLRRGAAGAGGGPNAGDRKPDLHGPKGGGGSSLRRGDGGVGHHRAAPAGGRRQLRPPQGTALLGVRPDAVRGATGEERRQLRPLPRPDGGEGAV